MPYVSYSRIVLPELAGLTWTTSAQPQRDGAGNIFALANTGEGGGDYVVLKGDMTDGRWKVVLWLLRAEPASSWLPSVINRIPWVRRPARPQEAYHVVGKAAAGGLVILGVDLHILPTARALESEVGDERRNLLRQLVIKEAGVAPYPWENPALLGSRVAARGAAWLGNPMESAAPVEEPVNLVWDMAPEAMDFGYPPEVLAQD